MAKRKKRFVGKIGYCDNKVLGIKDKYGNYLKGGHYVYIREMNDDGTYNVNTITSLEDKNAKYKIAKIRGIKQGTLYAIPEKDANFKLWSAINLDSNTNNIKETDIKSIGKKKMKHRYKIFVGKFSK